MISEGSCDTDVWSNDALPSHKQTPIFWLLKYFYIFMRVAQKVLMWNQQKWLALNLTPPAEQLSFLFCIH